MQRRKLGMAVVWTVCLLGMVAVVWSRPPLGGTGAASHPPLTLADDVSDVQHVPSAVVENAPPTANVSASTPPPVVSPVPRPVGGSEGHVLPSGQWTRDLKICKIAIESEGHQLRVTISVPADKSNTVEYRFSADCHVTQDAILYGVITSSEIEIKGIPVEDANSYLEATMTMANPFFDQPFAVRYRLDPEALTIKDLKIGPIASLSGDLSELPRLAVGRYPVAKPPATEQIR